MTRLGEPVTSRRRRVSAWSPVTTLVRAFHQPWPYPIEGDELGDVEYALAKADWEEQNRQP